MCINVRISQNNYMSLKVNTTGAQNNFTIKNHNFLLNYPAMVPMYLNDREAEKCFV